MNTLYILQGGSGSGKSTLASVMQKGIENSVVYSTDDFHLENGNYVFKGAKLPEFHKKNLERSKLALAQGKTVIVDNTNIRAWECREYVRYAVLNKIPVVFIRVNGNFQTVHGVPQDKIDKMKADMENLTVESVLSSKAPWEK